MCNRCVGVFRAAGVFRPQIPLPCIDLQSLTLSLFFDWEIQIQINYTRLCGGDEFWPWVAICLFRSHPPPCPALPAEREKHAGPPPKPFDNHA